MRRGGPRKLCTTVNLGAATTLVQMGHRLLYARATFANKVSFAFAEKAADDLAAWYAARDIVADAARVALERGITGSSPTDPTFKTVPVEHDEDDEE